MFLLPPFLLPPFLRPLQLGLGFALGWMLRGRTEPDSLTEPQEARR
jgi:hypothetical protein